ncbi:MAG: DUF11 domain-containing protein [Chloroflexi bacterium]|nr:DUF11 domain-containing protein [Chloroflexota bacterium]
MKGQKFTPSPTAVLAVAVIVTILLSCTCPTIQPAGDGAAAVSITFTADRTSIQPGECATLKWTVEGSGQFWVELNEESVSPSSFRQVCPPQTTTYRLVAGTGAAPKQELRRSEITIAVSGGATSPPTKPASPLTQVPTKPASPPTKAPTQPPPPPTQPPTATPLTFTFSPQSGPAGSDVKLYLSAAVQSVTVYYNGQALPKKVLDGGKTLEVTIPGDASGSGYFELQWDGQSVKAAEPFTVTPPPLTFTFSPQSGPAGSDVKLYLSAPVQPVTVYYNGQALPKKVLDGGKTLEVTIPGNAAGSGYFELQWNGQSVKASNPFTVTPPPAAGLSADLAVTDIYPDNMPQGKVWVRITNHGHGTVTNVGITLEYTALSTPRPGIYAPSQPVHAQRTIIINLSPGQTAAFDTGVTVDTDSFTYSVTASIQVPFQDPNPANNSYSEAIP